eukprot:12551264-Alexandrium_andersonii.AAC.1
MPRPGFGAIVCVLIPMAATKSASGLRGRQALWPDLANLPHAHPNGAATMQLRWPMKHRVLIGMVQG